MKVLLTGHKGYIGSRLLPMLLDRGHDVTGLDSDLFGACTYTGDLAAVPEINYRYTGRRERAPRGF